MSDMFMFMPTKFFWAMMIIWLSSILIILVAFGHASGHQFTFDMTDRLNNETKQLEKCIAGTNTTSCARIYGGDVVRQTPMDELRSILGIPKAYGQDIDPRYVCLYKDQYPFNKMCQEQRIRNTVNDTLNLAKENDAKFCHVLANLSYCQNKCEVDESLCVLGIPDPDFNDTGTDAQINKSSFETIQAPEGWACFDNKTLADKFLKIPGNEHFNVSIGCNKSRIINPTEDESGK